jgi:hypothetical protein
MTPDTSDIARRLRQTRANMIGTDDEQHYWDAHEAAGEIERLRLTDAERQAVDDAAIWYGGVEEDARCQAIASTLRGLLERMSGDGDCPAPGNAAKPDCTETGGL